MLEDVGNGGVSSVLNQCLADGMTLRGRAFAGFFKAVEQIIGFCLLIHYYHLGMILKTCFYPSTSMGSCQWLRTGWVFRSGGNKEELRPSGL